MEQYNKDLAQFAMKYLREKGVAYAEVRLEHTYSDHVAMQNGITQAGSFDESTGMGIRFVHKNTIGFMSTDRIEKDLLKDLIDKNFASVDKDCKNKKSKIDFAKEANHVIEYKATQKEKIKDVSIEEKMKYLYELDELMKDKKFNTASRYLAFSTRNTEKYFIDSEGSEISSEIPYLDLFYLFTVAQNDKSKQRFRGIEVTTGWEGLKVMNAESEIENELVVLNDMIKNARKVEPGIYDVICGPEVTGIAVHESVGHPYEADRVLGREAAQAGESFVTESMLGQKIAPEEVTVVDDPTLEQKAGFYLYDDEGVKAREKELIKEGKITEFLHNRETAGAMKINSNAAARANAFHFEPIVRMSNTYLKPGSHTFDEMLNDTKKGIFINSFMEWNIDDKRFSQKYIGLEAYLIEDGNIVAPLENPILETNTLEFWSKICAVSKDNNKFFSASCGKGEPMQGIPVSLGGAALKLKDMKMR